MVLAEDLRQAVLQAALQGKLTEQLEIDSDVDEMLVSMQEEKKQFIADKKIKKEKPLPEIQEEDIPFDIPDNWRWVRLGDVVKAISAGGDKPKDFSKEKTSLFSIPVIANGETNDGILGYTNEAIIKEKSLTISGRGTIGFSVVRTEPYVPIVRLLVITPLEQTNLYYIQCVLKSLVEIGIGTAVKQLTVPMIQPKVIPLPPIEEQQRIVDKINEIMSKIDEYEKIEKEMEALKKTFPTDMKGAFLQAAMQGKLTEQLEGDSSVDELLQEIRGQELKCGNWKAKKELEIDDMLDIIDSPNIPDNWKWVKLSDIALSNIGLTYKPSDKSLDGVIVLRSSNIQNGKMDYNDIVKVNMEIPESKICNVGDILMCVRNGSKSLVGKVAMIDRSSMSFGAFMAIIKSKCNQFLYYFFNSNIFKKQMHINSSTETINQITQDMLFNCVIPLPPIEEQQRIVERLDALLPLCEELS